MTTMTSVSLSLYSTVPIMDSVLLPLSLQVVFQIPCETDMYNLIANLIVETNDKLVNERYLC